METDLNARVVKALRDFMADHQISQADIARRLGRSEGYVSQRMSGRLDLTVDIMGAAADLAGVSAFALMGELTERMNPAR